MANKEFDIADAVSDLVTDDTELREAAKRLANNRQKREAAKTGEGEGRTVLQVVEPPESDEAPMGLDTDSVSSVPRQAKRAPARQISNKPGPIVWSRPVTLLNTRIPPEMDDKLDELLAAAKRHWRSGNRHTAEPTKQSLIHEALEDLLRKHKIVTS